MKKNILLSIFGLVLVIIALAVAYKTYFTPLKYSQTTQKLSPSPTTNSFSSIKDALNKSLTLICEYPDTNNKFARVYIKNGAIRVDSNSTSSGEIDSVIMKENKLYIWSNKQNQGTVIDFSAENKQGSPAAAQLTSQTKLQDFLSTLEAQKNHCKPNLVEDTQFALPSDITFLDFAHMMQAASSAAQ